MIDRNFSLQPFPLDGSFPSVKIVGIVARNSNIFNLSYQLIGDLSKISIPTTIVKPLRKNELWQETCFEFFLANKNSPCYWEFNLSPSGDWNIYKFTNYRQGMQEETAFSSLPFYVEKRSNVLFLDLELNLNPIISIDRTVEISITAVIKTKENGISYWALTHGGTQADFHRRDDFTLKL